MQLMLDELNRGWFHLNFWLSHTQHRFTAAIGGYWNHPMDHFISQNSSHIKSIYTCTDRVIIRGYIRKMFTTGCIILFLRSLGFRKFTDGVMRIFTDQLNAHISREADKNSIPILWWPSVDGGTDGNKLKYVMRRYARRHKGKGNFVYCILADRERALTYSTRQLASKKGKSYDKMYKSSKHVKHYYIYIHDELLGGPCYLKLCTYFPFYAEFYFNGHNAIRLEMDRRSLRYRMADNAFTWVESPQAVQNIAWSLSGRQIQDRINYWMGRFFKFNKGTYSTRPKSLRHEWYCSQVEVCTNIIFKSAGYCTRLFDRLLDKYSRIGLPDSLSQIFKMRRCVRKETKSTRRLYNNKACGKNWFGRNSIKFYNKLGYFLRVETTINDPKSLGLHKPVFYFREYLTHGVKCNKRLYNCFADVDIKTIGNGELDQITQPVETEKGHKIAAVDLRKNRQRALMKELLKTTYHVHGFRTHEILKALPEFFQNVAQICYELRKLTARRLVKRRKGTFFWYVTDLGYRVMWVQITSVSHFKDPLITMAYNNSVPDYPVRRSQIEAAYHHLNVGLDMITKELFMIRDG